ncbi:MAG: DUF1488 domain-containing protein [Pseudolabrys sp.]
MAINFPNRSRSYDATRRAVHFWGYDRSMESSFFVTVDALNRIQPNLRLDAVDLLRAFDINRERICAIGAEAHTNSTPPTCDIAVLRLNLTKHSREDLAALRPVRRSKLICCQQGNP